MSRILAAQSRRSHGFPPSRSILAKWLLVRVDLCVIAHTVRIWRDGAVRHGACTRRDSIGVRCHAGAISNAGGVTRLHTCAASNGPGVRRCACTVSNAGRVTRRRGGAAANGGRVRLDGARASRRRGAGSYSTVINARSARGDMSCRSERNHCGAVAGWANASCRSTALRKTQTRQQAEHHSANQNFLHTLSYLL